jgi:hypothetical protein
MTIPTSPTFPTSQPTIAVSEYTATTLRELLGICEEFLRTAGPAVHAELRAYLACQNPPADPVWLIDMLGFHSLHLHHLTPATAASPREVSQEEQQGVQQ